MLMIISRRRKLRLNRWLSAFSTVSPRENHVTLAAYCSKSGPCIRKLLSFSNWNYRQSKHNISTRDVKVKDTEDLCNTYKQGTQAIVCVFLRRIVRVSKNTLQTVHFDHFGSFSITRGFNLEEKANSAKFRFEVQILFLEIEQTINNVTVAISKKYSKENCIVLYLSRK